MYKIHNKYPITTNLYGVHTCIFKYLNTRVFAYLCLKIRLYL